MTFNINIKTNIDAFQKKISALAYKQLPFATAQALTAIAKVVVVDEQANEKRALDRPKPFTTDAIGVLRANKTRMEATVFVKDITAAYLEPYQFGGANKLNGRALLKPVGAVKDLDQFGNLPRNFLKKLQGRKDIFIGTINTKHGPVSGVWQRSVEAGAAVATITKSGKIRNTRKATNNSGHLVLLVKFTDAHPVKQFLDWFKVAERSVHRNFNREMGKALGRAIASAR
jgi:hypothetical protein